MRFLKAALFCLIIQALLFGCRYSAKETRIAGEVNYNGETVSGASIEIYLKKEKDKSTPPFMTAETGGDGRFEISVPPGSYFIIGKKKSFESGITKMLFGEFPKNPVEAAAGDNVRLPPFSLFNMGEDKRLDIEGSGITGRVTRENGTASGSFVYVYPESAPDLIGPSYVVAQEVGGDGTFKINLLPGSYHVAIRQRGDKTKLGQLKIGDYSVEYDKNPVVVKPDDYFDLSELKLHPLDEEKLGRINNTEAKPSYTARITGRVTNEEGEPVKGIYVYGYRDPKMVGKPETISKKSDDKGNYVLYVTSDIKDTGDKYYIGARTNFGGPLEPGEHVGTYGGNPEHYILLKKGSDISGIDIAVKEVW